MKVHTIFSSLAVLSCAAVFSACGNTGDSSEVPETLFQGEYDGASMDAAMEQARGTLGHFRDVLAANSGENHAIKVAIQDGDQIEHFWLVEVLPVGDGFKGILNNEPGLVSNVEIGDEIEAVGEDISDWLYFLDDQMHGNYTLRVMLPGMPAEEAEFYRATLAPLPD
ncbi:MAG: DUF2314 domain-containing protein [Verrucomicrobiota bacterium]